MVLGIPPLMEPASYAQLYQLFRTGRSEPVRRAQPDSRQESWPMYLPQRGWSPRELYLLKRFAELYQPQPRNGSALKRAQLAPQAMHRYTKSRPVAAVALATAQDAVQKRRQMARNELAAQLRLLRDVISKRRQRRMCWGCHGRRGKRRAGPLPHWFLTSR